MATSGVDVSKFVTPSVDSVSSQIGNAIDKFYNITQQNNAASAAQAEQLRYWQEQQNQKAMEFNAMEAQKNRDWQQYMSNTAHQREVADLKAAGLNPILSASGGNGAAVTSGATASGVTSSGAKGDIDTSLSASVVQLLGTLINAQNQMEMQRMSAVTNQSIADRNNASAQLIAQINGLYGNERARISGEYGVKAAATGGSYSLAAAQTSALASMLNTQAQTQSAQSIAKMNVDNAVKLQNMKEEQEAYMSKYNALGGIPATLTDAIMSLFGYDAYSSNKSNRASTGSYGGGSGRR